MDTLPVPSPGEPPRWAWHRRVHRALMPDYNTFATAFWWLVVGAGAGLLAHAVHVTAAASWPILVQIAVCTLIAALTGFVPIRIPRTTNSMAAGEIFIFFILLVHGPLAGTLVAAAEAFVGSLRTSKRWSSRLSSPAMAGLAIFATGSAWSIATAALRTRGWLTDGIFLLAAIVFAVAYFAVNTAFMTALFYIKRLQWPPILTIWRSYQWLAIAYAGSASVSSLLAISFQNSGVVVMIATVPIIAILLITGHKFFRQQELEDAARAERRAVEEREALARLAHLEALQESERRFHSAFTHASIAMALVTPEGRILQTNLAFCRLLGLAEHDGVDRHLQAFMAPPEQANLQAVLAHLGESAEGSVAVEEPWTNASGDVVWVSVCCSVFSDAGSEQPRFIIQAQDISGRRRAENELERIAYQDMLTELPNRFAFNRHLSGALAAFKAQADDQFALLFLDFDRFKLINDSLGHSAGDDFLKQAARRIHRNVRPGDVVARLGGDEFAILVRAAEAEHSAVVLAERLLSQLRDPFTLSGTEITCSVSIGITCCSHRYDAPEDALRDADIAMYKAKAQGKARYALFDAELLRQVTQRVQLESELRRALAEGGLWVAYQPLFDLASGRLRGFEALARWRHATLGDINPMQFIPVAEESGLMPQLTDFMLAQTCAQLATWQAGGPEFAELTMNVNIAGGDLANGNLVERTSRVLLHANVAARHLTIELTEDILMERLAESMDTLNGLRHLGVRLSVDDFGTGYSSLSHLSTLPIDSLKIDRSFVKNLHKGSKEEAVIRAIVSLGHSLGKTVVAEGIEDEEQLEQLKAMDCDVGQGYFLSRPIPAAAIDDMLVLLATPHANAAAGVHPAAVSIH